MGLAYGLFLLLFGWALDAWHKEKLHRGAMELQRKIDAKAPNGSNITLLSVLVLDEYYKLMKVARVGMDTEWTPGMPDCIAFSYMYQHNMTDGYKVPRYVMDKALERYFDLGFCYYTRAKVDYPTLFSMHEDIEPMYSTYELDQMYIQVKKGCVCGLTRYFPSLTDPVYIPDWFDCDLFPRGWKDDPNPDGFTREAKEKRIHVLLTNNIIPCPNPAFGKKVTRVERDSWLNSQQGRPYQEFL